MIKTHHIDTAYQWVCQQRRHHPDNADIWHLRFHWAAERGRILQDLREGYYNFAPLRVITKADGRVIHLWRSPDALVLKALTLAIAPLLPISRRCTHVKGHGGLKYAVREVQHHLAANSFVLRTDVKAFYESINHSLMLDKLAIYIKDRFILNLLWQSMRRWAIKRLNGILNALRLEKHADKTFIGRIEKGFDFLGYHFSRRGLQLAAKTIANAVEKVHRLYEQKQTAHTRAAALDDYLTRWVRWTTAGLDNLALQPALMPTQAKTYQSQSA